MLTDLVVHGTWTASDSELSLVPLEEIPDRYVGDPQQGLKEILKRFPGASVIQTRSITKPEWITVVHVAPHDPLMDCVIVARYEDYQSVSASDTFKAQAIKLWLNELCNGVRKLNGDPPLSLAQMRLKVVSDRLPPVNQVKLALAGARVTPDDTVVPNKAYQSDLGDRLLASLKARRSNA